MSPAYFLGDLFYVDRHNYENIYEKTYYINVHQLIPCAYLKNVENQTKEICLSRIKKTEKKSSLSESNIYNCV